MKKILLIISFLLIICFIFLSSFLIYLNNKYEQAIVELKYGNIENSINKLENIKAFSSKSKKMLFEIYLDKKFNIDSPEKAYSYLDSFNNIEKEKMIKLALEYYDLSPNSKKFLENELEKIKK